MASGLVHPGASNWGDQDPGAATEQTEHPSYRKDPSCTSWISMLTKQRWEQDEDAYAVCMIAEYVPVVICMVGHMHICICMYVCCVCMLVCIPTQPCYSLHLVAQSYSSRATTGLLDSSLLMGFKCPFIRALEVVHELPSRSGGISTQALAGPQGQAAKTSSKSWCAMPVWDSYLTFSGWGVQRQLAHPKQSVLVSLHKVLTHHCYLLCKLLLCFGLPIWQQFHFFLFCFVADSATPCETEQS